VTHPRGNKENVKKIETEKRREEKRREEKRREEKRREEKRREEKRREEKIKKCYQPFVRVEFFTRSKKNINNCFLKSETLQTVPSVVYKTNIFILIYFICVILMPQLQFERNLFKDKWTFRQMIELIFV
jgi:hypothetical protein